MWRHKFEILLQDMHKATKHNRKMDLTDEMAVHKLVELASKVQQAAANNQVPKLFKISLLGVFSV